MSVAQFCSGGFLFSLSEFSGGALRRRSLLWLQQHDVLGPGALAVAVVVHPSGMFHPKCPRSETRVVWSARTLPLDVCS